MSIARFARHSLALNAGRGAVLRKAPLLLHRSPSNSLILPRGNVPARFSSSASAEETDTGKSIADGYTDVSSDMSKAKKLTSIQFSLPNRTGALIDFLVVLRDEDISLVQLASRESQDADSGEFITIFADLNCHAEDANFKRAYEKMQSMCPYISTISSHNIPWYPRHLCDVNTFRMETLAAGGDLQADHPGFSDPAYRKRRTQIADIALKYQLPDSVPEVEYTDEEVKTWGVVYRKLTSLFPTHACREYNYVFALMVENCGYGPNRIPQLATVNSFLQKQTGWRLKPVTGLLGPRDFLNGFAFRVFHSTQYIRHGATPLYTPEPDICHELLGHAPMLADPTFAEFSHQLGLASLGASDEEIKALAALYWFTVEFGLVEEHKGPRAYGAGILSSPSETEWALRSVYDKDNAEKPVLRELICSEASATDYTSRITKLQPEYFVAKSFAEMVRGMKEFASSFDKPFYLRFNPFSNTVSTHTLNAERYMRGLKSDFQAM
eukprot:TRINITY_DN23602_c0_g1_i1.p1 TRINITY_DN23602_c0_g1~~TRINITY_DN23602_c0_g1_i1.p1  ORF type:complete len:496 (+),score=119.59 TRINITY_DN23602_c0_g1_i1:53-1540(+)